MDQIAAPTKLTGASLLSDPVLNRDTAFTADERQAYGLEGLLPQAVETLDRQFERAIVQLDQKDSDLERYIYLTGLSDRNETLFFRVIMSDPKRFVPIVYDPTIAEACLTFGHIYRRPKGMYVSIDMRGRVAEVLRNWPVREVHTICVSTGGRILGLGDLGTDGMAIPIGKLQLYTACAAVPPAGMLPILLDIGTTNAAYRADGLYLGLRQAPPPDDELDRFVDEFVQAVQDVFPGCCIHFEDWKGTDALRMLDRYRDKILCYNDDIQGTASVTIAGLITALEIKGEKLVDQRYLFFGAGSAALGIGGLIVSAMMNKGLAEKDAQARVAMVDIHGLIEPSRKDLNKWQKTYAHQAEPTKDLVKVIEMFKPTVLIGVSTVGGTFTQSVVEAMCKITDRPIIFPLSNPTDKCEVLPQQAYEWSEGKVLYASGVQFADVTYDGKTFHPGQANNFYIFPAVGLATYCAKPTRLTDEVFIAAAEASAEQVSDDLRRKGMLYPSQSNILETEITTAVRVVEFMFDKGLATVGRPKDIRAFVESKLYKPAYAGRA